MIQLIQLSLVTIMVGVMYLLSGDVWEVMWFGLGMFLGWVVLWLDKFVLYKYYLEKTAAPGVVKNLITRSIIFLLAFIPLSLYVVTSSGSLIGQGVIMAMGIVFATEVVMFRKNETGFAQKFLWQTKTQFHQKERNLFSAVFVGVMIVMSLLILI